MTVTCLIVAAGSGERFGGDIPKQYLDLGGMPILRRSVLAFLHHPLINAVHVVFNPKHEKLYQAAVGDLPLPPPTIGGITRQDSVRLGLEALASQQGPRHVLIHDAARPLIDANTITDVCKALETHAGAIAAKPLVDTLKKADGATIAATIDRTHLWQAHTPQGFQFNALYQAHQKAKGQNLTDDAAVAEAAGLPVALIPSNPDNMKITNPDDLGRAARLLGQPLDDIRTGFGFDVHRLIPGNLITLCGVEIPHNQTLEGHSDADVALHAVCDAIFGALGDGDIGIHFPNTDPQWRGKASGHFVHYAVGKVRERGGVIAHVDVTLLCERPKISAHRQAMLAKLAELLDVTPDRVALKATTTERMGFTGREEGIAAQAVATVRLPVVR
ncbi:MAG: bifunctional 2-C-methyl-D-erythritol 4-phosphate cytidylyltransferase/2-C-methyl-D-erythritol 2,4-cyclodiphosphate synthase [Alphaproteobacteria bacterium]|nr:bifunctional 2-C-methyl-D-erythritol 4-phosphate cytidylyltransferase/2-C-methyl-D-erythritol 2,4-cyclodiphosphate synthase [Alphaproteobacteria bacterium]NDG03771.1 bifunctional 2-C-methyl-D-erythritol 4-phosphate cytidylyltransferase/2-C-methyl-D-erythritol 2,4-cyclodiphosphate synthase [Alphaproteobacteria bacterium]